MIERVAANAVMHLELGPKTRGLIKALSQKDSKEKDEDEGLLRKGVEPEPPPKKLRRVSRRLIRKLSNWRLRTQQEDGSAAIPPAVGDPGLRNDRLATPETRNDLQSLVNLTSERMQLGSLREQDGDEDADHVPWGSGPLIRNASGPILFVDMKLNTASSRGGATASRQLSRTG